MAATVLLIEPTIHPDGVARLGEQVDLVYAQAGTTEVLANRLSVTQAAGLITRSEQIPRHLIEQAPALRVIGQHGVGVDNICVEAATRQGVMVVNSPRANVPSTAEHALAMIFAVQRRLVQADRAVRGADFAFRERWPPVEITGKCLLVVGLGNIGCAVARLCRTALAMQVLAFDPGVSAERMRLLGIEKVDALKVATPRADIVSVHVPQSRHTHHLIDADFLSGLPAHAILINCARGCVVDEAALYMALHGGQLAGAGLDVFEQEPPDSDNPLFALNNVVVTPHVAGDTVEAKRRCSLDLADGVLRALRGEIPRFLVNADVLTRATDR